MSTHYLYSYPWAEDVVTSFLEKWWRGADFLAWASGISRQRLSLYLIHTVRLKNQTQWEAMKRMIKLLSHEKIRDFKHIPVSDRRKYLSIVKWNCQDAVLFEREVAAGYLTGFEAK